MFVSGMTFQFANPLKVVHSEQGMSFYLASAFWV